MNNFLSECQRAYFLNMTTKYFLPLSYPHLFLSRNMRILRHSMCAFTESLQNNTVLEGYLWDQIGLDEKSLGGDIRICFKSFRANNSQF